jgi:hypothetical protein
MLKALRSAAVVTIALACMAPSMAVNALHQLNHTPGPLAPPLAGAAVLSVLLAGSSPFVMEAAFKQRRFGVLLAALAAFVVCASYNLASAVGAASTSRSETMGARTADNTRVTLLTSQLAQAETSRAALAAASGEQTPGMIDNALSALRNDARWTRSKDCAFATLPDSRTFCIEYARKLAARDAAVKVEELDGQIAALKAQLLTAAGTTAGQAADPQADTIADALALVGTDASAGKIGMGLNLWFALTIEVLGSLGPVVFASMFRLSHDAPRPSPATGKQPDAEPEQVYAGLRIVSSGEPAEHPSPKPGSVSAWLASATETCIGKELRGGDAFKAYRRHVGALAEATSATQFRRLLLKAFGCQGRTRIVIKNNGFVIRDLALKPARVGGDVGDDLGKKIDPTLA